MIKPDAVYGEYHYSPIINASAMLSDIFRSMALSSQSDCPAGFTSQK